MSDNNTSHFTESREWNGWKHESSDDCQKTRMGGGRADVTWRDVVVRSRHEGGVGRQSSLADSTGQNHLIPSPPKKRCTFLHTLWWGNCVLPFLRAVNLVRAAETVIWRRCKKKWSEDLAGGAVTLINDGAHKVDGCSDDEHGKPTSVRLRHQLSSQRTTHYARYCRLQQPQLGQAHATLGQVAQRSNQLRLQERYYV